MPEIFKKGNRQNPSNYRPVSLTSIVAKLLESIIRDQIVSFLEQNEIITDNQFGFTKGKSCALQLLSVVDKWTESLDRGRSVDVLYTDFRKAFDSVAHRHLIYKLQSVGIKNKALKWCKSFLEERTQRVRVENVMSNSVPVTSGVPQGSVLGPVLFIIYINDIVAQAEKSNGNLFADDAKFDLAVDNENDRDHLQNDINNITRWSEEWKMSFNYDKCKILHVGKNNSCHEYFMDGAEGRKQLDQVKEEKDLGVNVDSLLNFKSHIGLITVKANKVLGIIRRTFKYQSPEVFINLYKSMVRPHLEYCSTVWSPSSVAEVKKLESVQRRATKMVKSVSKNSYPARLRALGMPTLEFRRLRSDMIQVFRILRGIDKIDHSKLFKLANNNRTRGHTLRLKKVMSNTNLRKNSFTQRVVAPWNSLSEDVVSAPSVDSFKQRLNKFWKDHPLKFEPSFF